MKLLLFLAAAAGLLAGADKTFLFETEQLTPYTRTYLGNGLIGLSSSQLGTVPTECFMAGVYDHAAGDVPRIAVIPAWNEVDVYNGHAWLNKTTVNDQSIRSYHQVLDMYDGTLRTEYEWWDDGRMINVQVENFVSRADTGLGAVEVRITPHFTGEVKVMLPLRAWPPPHRLPLEKLERLEGKAASDQWMFWYPGYMVPQHHAAIPQGNAELLEMVSRAEGRQTQVTEVIAADWPAGLKPKTEVPNRESSASVVQLSFSARDGHTYIFQKYAMMVSSSGLAGSLENVSARAKASRARGYEALRRDHANAWHQLWETDIQISGDPKLEGVIHSMIFYLLGSANKDSGVSIPPMGLSSSGYYGHMFWDGDTFMFPALAVLHPEMAKPLVMFRCRTLEAARANARRNGYRGAMYPWEADDEGRESTPHFAYQNALYENHVNADVALAEWQYFLATGDRNWLEKFGYPVIRETADFWISRVSYNRKRDRYEIGKVVSVDESKIGVNNDAYTNAAAKKNLELAVEASKLLGHAVNPKWADIAEKLYIPRQDLMLLDYPFGFSLSHSDQREILERAREAGRQNGVIMEIGFYPILAVEMRDRGVLDELLDNSYRRYVRLPFNVVPETPVNDNINFLTGAGAFLQQFLFGYTGLRFSAENGLSRKVQPLLPPSIHQLVLHNVTVRGRKTDVKISASYQAP